MRRLWLVAALALAPVAGAQEPPAEAPAEAPAGPTLGVRTLPDRPTDAERDEAIRPIEKALATDPAGAVALAEAAVGDSRPQLHADGWALLGDALFAQGFGHAAVDAWARSLAADPRALGPRIGQVLDRAEALEFGRPLEPGLVGAEATDPRVHLYVGRLALREGAIDEGLAAVTRVDKGSKHFPAAKLVEGALRSQRRDHQGALAAFATAQARGTDPSLPWRRAVEVNLARTYFALGNQPKALEHYANVDRGAPNWVHVHFETAWSHFRMGDMAGTLAALHSVESPFFATGYWAEAELLEAYALFYMCKFPSARAAIESFETRWKPVRAQLDAMPALTAAQAWDEFLAVDRGEAPRTLPIEVIDRYTWDVRAQQAVALSAALVDESERLTEAGLTGAAARVDGRRAELEKAEGERILANARAIRAELSEMLQDIEISKLDLLDLEKRLYEQASLRNDLGMGNPLGDIRAIRRKADHRVWPFEGEYWADEVGYYRVTARPDCPTDLQIGGR